MQGMVGQKKPEEEHNMDEVVPKVVEHTLKYVAELGLNMVQIVALVRPRDEV